MPLSHAANLTPSPRTLGQVQILKRLTAGVGSTFSAASMALTRKVCLPGFSRFSVVGETHDLNDLLSTWQRKLSGCMPPLPSKLILALRFAALSFTSVIVVSGGRASVA